MSTVASFDLGDGHCGFTSVAIGSETAVVTQRIVATIYGIIYKFYMNPFVRELGPTVVPILNSQPLVIGQSQIRLFEPYVEILLLQWS